MGSNKKRNAFISALICLILLMVFYGVIFKNDMEFNKERYSYIAKNEAEHIITTVDCVVSRINTLKVMVQENDGDISWFDTVAEELYVSVKDDTGVSLKNYALAPKGVVSDVYPLEGNESLIGFDFLDTSREGNLEAKEAYDNGTTILTNPFELVQGGIGMGAREPVTLRNDDTGSPWGLVAVTIDFDNLIEVLGLENLHGMGANYSLSYIDSDGNPHFFHRDGNLGDDTVKTQFEVRNLTWQIEMKPIKGWYSLWEIGLSLLFILVISGFVGILTYVALELRERSAVMQRLSTIDTLTGCHNRRAYDEKMLEIAQNGVDDDFVYVSADVNGLKHVNDTLGHSAGDEMLSGATSCMMEGFGPYGSVYRIGGDEFAALIHADKETFTEIMEKVYSSIENWRGKKVEKVSVSIGYASHRQYPEMKIEELNKTADRMMYVEKEEYYRHHIRG